MSVSLTDSLSLEALDEANGCVREAHLAKNHKGGLLPTANKTLRPSVLQPARN